MDMSKLRDSLPAGGRTDAELDLSNDFKAAALSITKLYKSSLAASTSAWSSGYQAALTELAEKMEGPVTLDDIREWARIRLDASGGVASAGELSDEDCERERDRDRDEQERRSSIHSKPSAKPDENPTVPRVAGTNRTGVQIYTDPSQDNVDEERSSLLRSPTALTAARAPFSSPTPAGPTSRDTSIKTRSRRSHVLRNTAPLSTLPIAATFAPTLPALSELSLFPAAVFDSTSAAPYGNGRKRRHDNADDTSASAAGRKARIRERGSGDSMDIDERERKRRR